MSAQPIQSPGQNDIVYNETPREPWLSRHDMLLAWSPVFGLLLIGAFFNVPTGTYIFLAVVATLLFAGMLLCTSNLYRSWRATWRWYQSEIVRVKRMSSLANYQLALRREPNEETVVLVLKNGHKLRFVTAPPQELLDAPSIVYKAAYIDNKFVYRHVQPSA